MARALFADVVIENSTAVSVLPQPDLTPFFVAESDSLKDTDAVPGSS